MFHISDISRILLLHYSLDFPALGWILRTSLWGISLASTLFSNYGASLTDTTTKKTP